MTSTLAPPAPPRHPSTGGSGRGFLDCRGHWQPLDDLDLSAEDAS
jgi:hypothetical protein